MRYLFIILLTLNIFYNHAYSDVINNIEVKNNDRITKESIITFSGIQLGKDYSQDQLNDILSDLYETNFFSDIKLNLDGDTLIVEVSERKIVQSIVLNGVKAEKNKKLILKNLNLKEKGPYIEFLAKQDLQKVKSSLNSSGYYFNDVEVSIGS